MTDFLGLTTMLRMLRYYQQLPEPVRLTLTAILGAGVGWVTYELIYWLNPLTRYRATTTWSLSFLIGVSRQHALHRTLTFTHESPYWGSLIRAYAFYSISGLIGAGVNYWLTEHLQVHHRLAWLCCLGITALLSILCLKRWVFIAAADER